jgi:hypothetical protein
MTQLKAEIAEYDVANLASPQSLPRRRGSYYQSIDGGDDPWAQRSNSSGTT